MTRTAFLSLALGIALSCSLPAQQLTTANPHRNCATMQAHAAILANNPGIDQKYADIERHTQLNGGLMGQHFGGSNVITIPVVFHVVWNTSAENLSAAELQSQIDVLNEDFRRTNPDAGNTRPQFQGVAADTEIEFCLATRDPQGNPHSGINRRQTSMSSFGTSGDPVKFNSSGGLDAWPASDYLNFWVCDISGGILGYAQFPGGPASTDGVVCDYRYTGRIGASAPFDQGRTATHEVGHWLNLRHIWGDGGCGVDDLVADTPASDGANYGCATSHSSCGSLDMVENYMDYSDDACMNCFTQGQKNRMRALFSPGGARYSILSSNGCGPITPPTADYQVNQFGASLTINGAVGTASTPAVSQMCVGDSGIFTMFSFLPNLFQVGFTLSPLYGGTTPPGSTTAAGQYININLAHPSTYYWGGNTPTLQPWVGNQSIPFTASAATVFSSQLLVVNGSNIDGFLLSAPSQIDIAGGGGAPTSHTLADDNSVSVSLTDPVDFYGTSYSTMYINSNGSVSFVSGSGDFSPTTSEFRNQDPRIAGNWSDLSPNIAGTITSAQSCGTATVSFMNVPEYANAAATSSFDITLWANGDTTIDNHNVSGSWGTSTLVGFSPGGGASGTSITWSSLIGSTQSYPTNNAVYEYTSGGPTSAFGSITRLANGSYTIN